MKKALLLFSLLFIFSSTFSQTLTGIIPNQGTAGTTLSAIITGQNTHFISGSPQGAQSIWIVNPNCGSVSGTNFSLIHDDSIGVDFNIPAGYPNGTYDIRMNLQSVILALPSALTIVGGVNYSIQSVTPSVANENSILSVTISGQGLQAFAALPGFYMRLAKTHTINPTNVNIINANTITADFQFLPYCDTGFYTLQMWSTSFCMNMPNAVYVQGSYPKQLVSVTPPTGASGTQLSAIITGQNIFFMSGSPQGIQNIQLKNQNCNVINGANAQVIDDDHFSADFNIPAGSSNGDYDLLVTTNIYHNYILANAFFISSGVDRNLQTLSPSVANAGVIVNATLTGDGMSSILAPGDSAYIVSNGNYRIDATNVVNVSTTQATMDFDIPIYADNGFYELRVGSATGCYKLPQAIQVQNASPRELVSITPNQGYRGQTLSALITSSYTFFMSGTVQNGVRRVHFNNSTTPSYNFVVFQPDINVLDSDHVALNLTIPFAVPSGFYDVIVETYSGIFYSLIPGFEIMGTRISGKVYFDVDSNGVFNTGDHYLPGRKVRISPTNVIAYTGQNGDFDFAVDSGQYTVEYYPDTNWIVTSSPPVHVLNMASTDTSGLLFGVNPIYDEYDIYATIIGGIARCAWNVQYQLSYTNYSTTLVSGLITFVPDSNLTGITSNPPYDFISGDTLFWIYDSLAVFGTASININVHMPATAGTNLNSYCIVNALDGLGNVLASTTDSLHQVVVCSYDPNDKSAEPEGILAGHYTLNSNFVEYLVRFQNTGTDTAFQVMILDTIDPGFDPTSLEILASSHAVDVHLNGNVVEFRFDNILLPDSNVDEPGSHGFVKFRIMPLSTIGSGVLVNNKAYIYFDLNSAVITNNVFNTLVDHLPTVSVPEINSDNLLFVFPNPASRSVTIVLGDEKNAKTTLSIYNYNGKLIKRIETRDQRVQIDVSNLPGGIYFILADDNVKRRTGRLIVE